MAADELLELAEAAKLLGVHQSTLRRWADSGRVSHIRTLTGRRRFSRAAILQAREEMTSSSVPVEADTFEEKTLSMARQRSSDLPREHAGWMAHLSDEQRMLFRYGGQRLMGLMLQFISRNGNADKFLAEGQRVAGDYGRICYNAGLSISETAEAFLYFRRSIIESVQVTSGLGGPNDADGHRIFLRTIDFFDALLVATIESYDRMLSSGAN